MGEELPAKAKANPNPSHPHILVFPYPAQGHINPALAFSKSLVSKGILVTIITTTTIAKSAVISPCASIAIKTISDGSQHLKQPESIEDYFKRFKSVVSKSLAELIDEEMMIGTAAKVIVYDSSMPWVLDIAHEKGLLGASFFTQGCGVSAVYYHLKHGNLIYPYEDKDPCATVSLPCLPALGMDDLPSFSEFTDAKHSVMRLLADQFSNLEEADWIFFNTFDQLEYEVLKWMSSLYPVKTIGPTVSLANNKNHMISLLEPNDEACTTWLDSKPTNSVTYISFGSIASLTQPQMEEIANGLILSKSYFLWVVRPSEVTKLPSNFNPEKGLIVEWCHQPRVLAHPSVACFMTHCGWNSTLEALSSGVSLIGMARWVDQPTNSKYIEDVWRVGVRVKGSESGIVDREEIAMCVKKVMEGGEGTELRRNACKWKELANEAVGKGGTSTNNIEEFVSKLMYM